MALAQKTKTLILDEPTTFLDIAHQLDVMELLKELNEIHDLTVLMVLHDLQQAAKYCDYLIAMKGGDVFQTGAPNEVMNEFFSGVIRHRGRSRDKRVPAYYANRNN